MEKYICDKDCIRLFYRSKKSEASDTCDFVICGLSAEGSTSLS